MSLGTTFWPCQIKSSVCWSTSAERTASDDRFWVNCNPFKMTCTKVLSLLKSQLTPIAFFDTKVRDLECHCVFGHFQLYKSHLFIKHISPLSQIVSGGKTAHVFYCCEWSPSEFGSFGPSVWLWRLWFLLCIRPCRIFFFFSSVWWTLLNSVLTEMGSDRFTKG